MSDEAIEETLEKVRNIYTFTSMNLIHVVLTGPQHTSTFFINWTYMVLTLVFVLVYLQVVKLLAYISDKDLFAEFYR